MITVGVLMIRITQVSILTGVAALGGVSPVSPVSLPPPVSAPISAPAPASPPGLLRSLLAPGYRPLGVSGAVAWHL